jgi:hypothetical protein
MNWTRRDLRRFEARTSGLGAAPAVKAQTGRWVEETFFLPIPVPTKKNGKSAFSGRVVIPKATRDVLDAITQAAAIAWRGRPPLSNVTLDLTFHTSNLRQDDDGAVTSCVDSLVDAGVMVDDSRLHITGGGSYRHVLVPLGAEEGVLVHLKGQEYRALK